MIDNILIRGGYSKEHIDNMETDEYEAAIMLTIEQQKKDNEQRQARGI